ncbi:MAG: hypothetical protein IJT69_03485 [Clostridia bacterium]|nr:hypothetical protein [Clostridia bacterium]
MILTAESIEEYCTGQGRRYIADGCLFLNPSGASLKGRFRGESLTLDLLSEPVVSDRNGYVRLTVDGRSRRIRLPKRGKRLTLAVPAGEHLFELLKLNESESNSLAVRFLETDGEFLPYKEQKPLRIEFVGDSITTGYGVRAPQADGHYCTKEQDFTLSYAYLTARALNAEYSVVAASGWGMYRSKYAEHAMPDFYGCVDLTRNEKKYDFSFRPDYIVLALGTNDFSYLADLDEAARMRELVAFRDHTVAFVRRLLTENAKVIFVYGFAGSERQAGFPAFAEEVWRAVDDPRFYTLGVRSNYDLDDIRAGHPGRKTHRLAAARLIRMIEKDLR